ncbi:hypothetical protein V6Z12_A01G157900 [Gossypium hirsutum]
MVNGWKQGKTLCFKVLEIKNLDSGTIDSNVGLEVQTLSFVYKLFPSLEKVTCLMDESELSFSC